MLAVRVVASTCIFGRCSYGFGLALLTVLAAVHIITASGVILAVILLVLMLTVRVVTSARILG